MNENLKKKRTQSTKIKKERGDIPVDPTKMRMQREYCEQRGDE